MIKIRDLNFSYRKNKKLHKVFDSLTVYFERGFNVILGPNGAGKSTLLKSIFGLLEYEGEICYGDQVISTLTRDEIVNLMSYLPQIDIDKSTLSVLEMVLLGRLPELGHKVTDKDLELAMNTLKSLNIDHLALRKINELSGGQKKLVFIAQTLSRNPKLILLDEPVNSLDLQKQLELCQLLQRIVVSRKVDIIVALHDINLAARYAQHIVVLRDDGTYYSSGLSGEVITEEMLHEVYGVIANVSLDEDNVPIVSPIRSIRTV
ncbi:ABC transporter ATP-binding protein [Maledivibacter halophilus]|nr:ABC transporter ATP-binding protein [Maledivibacter halophilus]